MQQQLSGLRDLRIRGATGIRDEAVVAAFVFIVWRVDLQRAGDGAAGDGVFRAIADRHTIAPPGEAHGQRRCHIIRRGTHRMLRGICTTGVKACLKARAIPRDAHGYRRESRTRCGGKNRLAHDARTDGDDGFIGLRDVTQGLHKHAVAARIGRGDICFHIGRARRARDDLTILRPRHRAGQCRVICALQRKGIPRDQSAAQRMLRDDGMLININRDGIGLHAEAPLVDGPCLIHTGIRRLEIESLMQEGTRRVRHRLG